MILLQERKCSQRKRRTTIRNLCKGNVGKLSLKYKNTKKKKRKNHQSRYQPSRWQSAKKMECAACKRLQKCTRDGQKTPGPGRHEPGPGRHEPVQAAMNWKTSLNCAYFGGETEWFPRYYCLTRTLRTQNQNCIVRLTSSSITRRTTTVSSLSVVCSLLIVLPVVIAGDTKDGLVLPLLIRYTS